MNNRLEMLKWKRDWILCRGLWSSRIGLVSSRGISPAARKGALRTVDSAIRDSIGPAGVPEWSDQLREKLMLSVQTPAGGGRMIAPAVSRDWSVAGMTFPPKGYFVLRTKENLKVKKGK